MGEFKDASKKARISAPKKEGTDGEDVEMKEEEQPKMEINVEDLDVFGVDDVMDLGNGEPLFANFVYEDWALLSLRFELHLLVHAFRHDLNDPERPAFHENHLSFYCNKYYHKPLNLKSYGVSKLAELFDMLPDTVKISARNSTIESQLPEDTPMENFVKLTEEHRRDRQRRADAGDEAAVLKFLRSMPASAPRQPQQPQQPHKVVQSPVPRFVGGNGNRAAPTQPSRPYYAQPTMPGRPYGSTAVISGAQKRPAPPAYPPPNKPRITYGSGIYNSAYSGGAYGNAPL